MCNSVYVLKCNTKVSWQNIGTNLCTSFFDLNDCHPIFSLDLMVFSNTKKPPWRTHKGTWRVVWRCRWRWNWWWGATAPSPPPNVPSYPSSPQLKRQRHDLDDNPECTTHPYTFEEFDALLISAWGKTLWNKLLHESWEFWIKKTEVWRLALNKAFGSLKALFASINYLVWLLKTKTGCQAQRWQEQQGRIFLQEHCCSTEVNVPGPA